MLSGFGKKRGHTVNYIEIKTTLVAITYDFQLLL